MSFPPITVLVFEPHPLMRDALCSAIACETDLEVVGQTTTYKDTLVAVTQLRPSIILFALCNVSNADADILRTLRSLAPEAHILALTSDEAIGHEAGALASGAQAVLDKTASRDDLLRSLRQVSLHSREKV